MIFDHKKMIYFIPFTFYYYQMEEFFKIKKHIDECKEGGKVHMLPKNIYMEHFLKNDKYCVYNNKKNCPGNYFFNKLKIGSYDTLINDIDVDKVISQCEPAKFGRGNQTVYDTTIRKAYSTKNYDYKLSWNINNSIMDLMNICDDIAYMFDDGDPALKVESNRLNVYQVGDFFKSHKDTITNDKLFATIVVCLPVKHKGGELLIRHNGKERKIDFSKKSESYLQWAVFYTDCEHEILPVIEGSRITLTYNVYFDINKTYPDSLEFLQPSCIHNDHKFLNSIKCLTPNRETIGLLLTYEYTTNKLDPCQLKGMDLQLYNVIKNNYKLSLVPIIYDISRCNYDYNICNLSYKIFDLYNEPFDKNINNVYALQTTYDTLISHQEGAEHTGNEALPEEHQYYVFLLVIENVDFEPGQIGYLNAKQDYDNLIS